MRAVIFCVLAVVALAAASVLADDHVVLVDDDVDFSMFRTFTIRDVNISSRHPALGSPVLRTQLRDATQALLVGRGLTSTSNQPGLIVECSVRGVDFGIDRQSRPVEQGRGGRRRQPNPNRADFTEATLVIDVIRADTKALVWRGVQADPTADFSVLWTFAFRAQQIQSRREELDNPLFLKKLTTAIRAALVAKGLTEARDRPDLLVDFTVTGQEFGDAERRLVRGIRGRPVAVRRPIRISEGTLVIDIVRRDDADLARCVPRRREDRIETDVQAARGREETARRVPEADETLA